MGRGQMRRRRGNGWKTRTVKGWRKKWGEKEQERKEITINEKRISMIEKN
jgi:hypothetical protein